MSLLFTHLVEDDYPAFDRELKRDVQELGDCYTKTIEMADISLVDRMEKFASKSLGVKFSIQELLLKGIEIQMAIQHPNAKPGDVVIVRGEELEMEVTVTENGGFTQSIDQMMSTFDRTREEIESDIFQQQIDRVGNKPCADYLDITEKFWHPLSDIHMKEGRQWLNLHATGSMFVNCGYLAPHETGDNGAISRTNLKKMLGDNLTPEIEQKLHDRHKPTIYLVCGWIVDRITTQIEEF
jgi:hypothetical protein